MSRYQMSRTLTCTHAHQLSPTKKNSEILFTLNLWASSLRICVFAQRKQLLEVKGEWWLRAKKLDEAKWNEIQFHDLRNCKNVKISSYWSMLTREHFAWGCVHELFGSHNPSHMCLITRTPRSVYDVERRTAHTTQNLTFITIVFKICQVFTTPRNKLINILPDIIE